MLLSEGFFLERFFVGRRDIDSFRDDERIPSENSQYLILDVGHFPEGRGDSIYICPRESVSSCLAFKCHGIGGSWYRPRLVCTQYVSRVPLMVSKSANMLCISSLSPSLLNLV